MHSTCTEYKYIHFYSLTQHLNLLLLLVLMKNYELETTTSGPMHHWNNLICSKYQEINWCLSVFSDF